MRRAGQVAVGMLASAMALGGAVGCDPGPAPNTNSDGGASAVDGGVGLDASPNIQGLRVLWACEPMPVAQLDDGLWLSDVYLHLRDVRVIGDSAPGDPRTSVDELELRWRDGEEPDPLFFPEAPLGLYSRFEFKVEGDGGGVGDGGAIRLRGEVQLEGDNEPTSFEIQDAAAFSGSLAVDIELQVGQGGTLVVTFDAAAVLAVVDWESVPRNDDGDLELDEDSPQIGAVRAALADGFFVETLP